MQVFLLQTRGNSESTEMRAFRHLKWTIVPGIFTDWTHLAILSASQGILCPDTAALQGIVKHKTSDNCQHSHEAHTDIEIRPCISEGRFDFLLDACSVKDSGFRRDAQNIPSLTSTCPYFARLMAPTSALGIYGTCCWRLQRDPERRDTSWQE